ncbi:MAG: hypothetical protein LJE69_14115 [Thiohalocapsa sp.]|uniref:hypothetical protein n=1 Tax=Thiohalocapsa sp. TaxID=2497641 RepID=UPI0025F7259A|nr:hypothetical protein [Thiohalocapsa sp.]MCG6942372.1 hypothetical protein [Thiohalocapsa sp.]
MNIQAVLRTGLARSRANARPLARPLLPGEPLRTQPPGPRVMNLHGLTRIARPLDFGDASNLAIALIAPATFLAVLLWPGIMGGEGAGHAWTATGEMAAAGAATGAGLAVFLAWAICRELDPDRAGAAVVASLLAIGGLAALGLPSIGACILVVLAVRVLNRTTGMPATLLDGLLLLALGVWVGLDRGWLYPAAAAAALLGDSLLPAREPRRFAMALAGAAAAFGILYLLGFPDAGDDAQPSLAAGAAAVLALLLILPTMRAISHLKSLGDAAGTPLLPMRVGAGQALALGVVVIAAVTRGFAGLTELMPLWTAVIATGLFRWLSGAGTPE